MGIFSISIILLFLKTKWNICRIFFFKFIERYLFLLSAIGQTQKFRKNGVFDEDHVEQEYVPESNQRMMSYSESK